MNITTIGRSQIGPPIVLKTPLSLQDITSNLRARANDWRESSIPAELREIGVSKLVLSEDGNDLSIQWEGRTSPVNNPACFLTVARIPGGGSEVTVTFGRGALRILALLLLLSTPLQAIARERGQVRWFFVAVSLAISLAYLITGRSNTPILQAHLLQIVEETTRSSYKPPSSRFSRMVPKDDGEF